MSRLTLVFDVATLQLAWKVRLANDTAPRNDRIVFLGASAWLVLGFLVTKESEHLTMAHISAAAIVQRTWLAVQKSHAATAALEKILELEGEIDANSASNAQLRPDQRAKLPPAWSRLLGPGTCIATRYAQQAQMYVVVLFDSIVLPPKKIHFNHAINIVKNGVEMYPSADELQRVLAAIRLNP